ncbi:hypothetical protein ACFYO7_11760 [Nocardia salmonicida]|uniref:Rv0361 family membrane protein n=1 Tax=Nocardia salmonicida TaxID=53431 RepID=UPI0036AECD65
MSRADLTNDASDIKDDNASAPSDKSDRGSTAAAASGAAAGAVIAAGDSGTDEALNPKADGDSSTRVQDGGAPSSATDKAAAEADSKESETARSATPAADPKDEPTAASAGGPEAASSETGAADSREDKPVDVEATEKFSTSKPTGDASSEDQTVAMKVANSADSPTTAMPVQRAKTAGPGGTDRVVPPAGARPAMTPPPNTPRGPAGPRQAGQPAPGQLGPAGPGQSPAGPGQHGPVGPGQQGPPRGPQQGPVGPRPGGPGQQAPVGSGQQGLGQQGPGPQGSRGAEQRGVEETQPSPPRGPGAPQRTGGSAPSPADIQPTRPAQQLAEGQRQVAPPQRIGVQGEAPAEPGAKKSKKWLLAAGGAAVLVVALIATVVALMGTDDSPEGQVKAVIGDYTDALRSGDLEDLRASTCGELHTFYQGISAEQFKGVHEVSTERGSIPVVDSVDAVRITGDTALAQATVYTTADPSKRTARTFDLQRTDGSWKVCDPAGTP